jgi:hypothetical protein
VEQVVDESGELVERVAALDIGKASVMACIRVPHEDGRRRSQEVREYGATTGALLALAGHLHGKGVTLVVMEATSDYWKPVFCLLSTRTPWVSRVRPAPISAQVLGEPVMRLEYRSCECQRTFCGCMTVLS